MCLPVWMLVSAALVSAGLGSLSPDKSLSKRHYPEQHHYDHHHHHHHHHLTRWFKASPLYPAAAEEEPFYPATVSCRYFCPRPDYHLYLPKHWYYCCLPRTPGATHLQCPEQSGHCPVGDPVTPEVTALVTCWYDSQCPSHRDLCCYDICQRRNVCKRATLSHVPNW